MSEFPIRVSPVPTEEYLKLKQQSENEVKKSSDHLQLFVSQPQHLSIPPMQPYLITSAEHTKPPNFPPHLASTDEYLKLNQQNGHQVKNVEQPPIQQYLSKSTEYSKLPSYPTYLSSVEEYQKLSAAQEGGKAPASVLSKSTEYSKLPSYPTYLSPVEEYQKLSAAQEGGKAPASVGVTPIQQYLSKSTHYSESPAYPNNLSGQYDLNLEDRKNPNDAAIKAPSATDAASRPPTQDSKPTERQVDETVTRPAVLRAAPEVNTTGPTSAPPRVDPVSAPPTSSPASAAPPPAAKTQVNEPPSPAGRACRGR